MNTTPAAIGIDAPPDVAEPTSLTYRIADELLADEVAVDRDDSGKQRLRRTPRDYSRAAVDCSGASRINDRKRCRRANRSRDAADHRRRCVYRHEIACDIGLRRNRLRCRVRVFDQERQFTISFGGL